MVIEIITSLLGIISIFAIAYLCSNAKQQINWRTIGFAFLLQVFIAVFVFFTPFGKTALLTISTWVTGVIAYSQEGIGFLFGDIGNNKLGFIFAFTVLPVIVFFSSLIAILYYLGIMSFIIRTLGGSLQKLLGTSKAESMSAAANIFVGQIEAPIVIRPYLANMTQSELFAVMVGGLATIAGSVLAGFVSLGIDVKYLIAASFMAAPAGLLMAKLFMPETDKPKNDIIPEIEDAESVNIIDAAANGALRGLFLATSVGAVLLAFVSLIALINGIIGGVGGWFGYPDITLQVILGYVFQPIAYIIGIPWQESHIAGSLIGQKVVINEFVAYADFLNYEQALSEKSKIITTFALCGFANFGSIAVLLGGLGAMAPDRKADIAKFGLKAVLAGTLANLLSAAVIGVLLSFNIAI